MSGHCKDCKFWEHNEDQWRKRWHECSAADSAERGEAIPDDAMAMYGDAADDTDLNYGLKTGPMFGCIKFKQA